MASDDKSSLPTTRGVELWFEKISNEIRVLNAEIDHEDGILFLKVHTLSEEEINAHPSFERIRTLCGQIDDLYGRWRANENITDDEYKFYSEKRIDVERALAALRVRIVERKPTFLDIILRAFDAVASHVGEGMLKLIGYDKV